MLINTMGELLLNFSLAPFHLTGLSDGQFSNRLILAKTRAAILRTVARKNERAPFRFKPCKAAKWKNFCQHIPLLKENQPQIISLTDKSYIVISHLKTNYYV